MTESIVWFVVPQGFDDPDRVSGGNVYDQRVRDELGRLGWEVRTVEAPVGDSGAEPHGADPFDRIPDGGLVLVDGLVAIGGAAAVDAAANRLRLVALVHMLTEALPGADARAVERERRFLSRARAVIAVSEWLRDELVQRGLSTPARVAVAAPGTDDAAVARGTPEGRSLLCVGVVAPHKGQDTLVEALGEIGVERQWTCTLIGSGEADRAFAARVAARARSAGLSQRVTWAGVLTAGELDAAYSAADVLIAPSRTESYGIAVGEALRRGIPVIASRAGGLPEAAQPADAALLVPPGDPFALGLAVRRWIEDPGLRARMTAAARRAAPARRHWRDTALIIHATLAELS